MVDTGKDVEHVNARRPISFVAEPIISSFVFKRRSNPRAGFAEMVAHLTEAVRKDPEMREAFAAFQNNFSGVVLTQEDAVRLTAVEKRGAAKLGIKVGPLPTAIGPGLTLMYDAAIETLRSSDKPIKPDMINPRMIRMIGRSLDQLLPLLGSTSATALELALDDKGYKDHLSQTATEIGNVYFNSNWNTQCEFCRFESRDEDGNTTGVHCGTEEECDQMGIILIILLVVIVVKELWDWLWD